MGFVAHRRLSPVTVYSNHCAGIARVGNGRICSGITGTILPLSVGGSFGGILAGKKFYQPKTEVPNIRTRRWKILKAAD